MSGLTHSALTITGGEKTLPAATMARAPFAEVLATARRNPLLLTHKGKPAAVLMTAARYRKILRAISALMEEAEDREWATKARRARKQGFITKAQSAALTRRLRQANGG